MTQKTDLQQKIDALRDSENGRVMDSNECEKQNYTIYCCDSERTPEYALQFANEKILYFVCPECGDF